MKRRSARDFVDVIIRRRSRRRGWEENEKEDKNLWRGGDGQKGGIAIVLKWIRGGSGGRGGGLEEEQKKNSCSVRRKDQLDSGTKQRVSQLYTTSPLGLYTEQSPCTVAICQCTTANFFLVFLRSWPEVWKMFLRLLLLLTDTQKRTIN